MDRVNRRHFLRDSVGAAAGASALVAARRVPARTAWPNETVIVGVMGIRGRGNWLARHFASRPDVEVAYLCDVDSTLFASRSKTVEQAQGRAPKTVTDVRRVLDDPDVDALVIATPDHWHALGTILACQAGKDVYVEKPASHSIWEGRKMVEAARNHKRVVQLGTQTRSAPYAQHAIEYLRSGKLGSIHLVRCFNMKTRGQVAKRNDETVPKGFDYDRWLGPVPMRPYNRNYVHSWNWFWDFSGGDIVNDGIHHMDLARWVVGKPHPKSVVATGGVFHLKDAAETPDTQSVQYEYDGLTLEFILTLWTPYMKKTAIEIRESDTFPNWPFNATKVEIYGTKGVMMLGRHGGGWQVFAEDWKGEPFEYGRQPSPAHIENFIQCIRTRKRPNADIEEGHLSTLLCHLGNISYRVGNRKLFFDSKTETFIDDPEANRLVKRTYREGYVIPEKV